MPLNSIEYIDCWLKGDGGQAGLLYPKVLYGWVKGDCIQYSCLVNVLLCRVCLKTVLEILMVP